MKLLAHFVLWLWVFLYTAFFLASCAFEETTTTTTDAKSGLVTVEKKTTKKADAVALGFAGDVFAAYASPRARRVREEKSGPISREEIANRWNP
jgi:hypothetical protein